IRPATERLDEDDLHQVLNFRRQRAETVDEFGAERVDLLQRLQLTETTVEREAKLQVGHIFFRDHDGGADRDLRRPAGLHRLAGATQLGNRLLQHLLIEFEAYLLDMAGLLVAQKIARTADVQVMACELKARAKRLKRLQYLQTPICRCRQLPVGRQGEKRV